MTSTRKGNGGVLPITCVTAYFSYSWYYDIWGNEIYFLKNPRKTYKPKNRDLNRDWIIYKSNTLQNFNTNNINCNIWKDIRVISLINFIQFDVNYAVNLW